MDKVLRLIVDLAQTALLGVGVCIVAMIGLRLRECVRTFASTHRVEEQK